MVDGEADNIESVALEAHLDECIECNDYHRDLGHLHARLGDELTDTCDVENIWERVEWSIAANETRHAKHGAPLHKKWWRYAAVQHVAGAALAALLLVTVMLSGNQLLWPDAKSLPIITETVRDFETFRLRGGLLDVAAKEPRVVRNWMAAKLDFDLPDDVSPPAGFKLAGGRLCSFLQRRLAFFHYEKDQSSLSLYVMKSAGLNIPKASSFSTARSAQGVTSVIWQRGDLVYVAVSDLPEAETVSFASGLIERGKGAQRRRL